MQPRFPLRYRPRRLVNPRNSHSRSQRFGDGVLSGYGAGRSEQVIQRCGGERPSRQTPPTRRRPPPRQQVPLPDPVPSRCRRAPVSYAGMSTNAVFVISACLTALAAVVATLTNQQVRAGLTTISRRLWYPVRRFLKWLSRNKPLRSVNSMNECDQCGSVPQVGFQGERTSPDGRRGLYPILRPMWAMPDRRLICDDCLRRLNRRAAPRKAAESSLA